VGLILQGVLIRENAAPVSPLLSFLVSAYTNLNPDWQRLMMEFEDRDGISERTNRKANAAILGLTSGGREFVGANMEWEVR
jgi:hypothetical protein